MYINIFLVQDATIFRMISQVKDAMQGKLIAAAYTLRTY